MILKHLGLGRDFWLFRCSQVVSELGDVFGMIALSWWTLQSTGSAADMAYVITPALVGRIGCTLLLSPLADRYSRKKLVAIADFLRAILWAGLAVIACMDEFHLLAVALLNFAIGIASALYAATITPLVFQLAPGDGATKAAQAAHLLSSAVAVFGAMLGGSAVAVLGVAMAFASNSFSFLIGALSAFCIRHATLPEAHLGTRSEPSQKQSWQRDLSEVIRHVCRDQTLLLIAALFIVFEFLAAPFTLLLTVLANTVHDATPALLGQLHASRAAGGLIVAVCYSALVCRVKKESVLFVYVALVGIGFFSLSIANSTLFWLTGASAIGGGLMGIQLTMIPALSAYIDKRYQARTFALLGFVTELCTPVGVLLAGTVLTYYSVYTYCAVIGSLWDPLESTCRHASLSIL